jgi:hypothetical protein
MEEDTRVVVSGLYGLTVCPAIPDLAPGLRYHGAPLWTVNSWPWSMAAKFYRPARIFNLHNDLKVCIENLGVDFEKHVGEPYDKAIADGVEIWLSEPTPRFPGARIYPFAEVKAWLGVNDWFFTSSISYMLALAYYEGRKDVALRCVSMANDDEYYWQALGILYAIRRGEEHGCYTDCPNRVIMEARFTPDDFRWYEQGFDADTPEDVKKSLYRCEKPYHVMDRFEQEPYAARALAHKRRRFM